MLAGYDFPAIQTFERTPSAPEFESHIEPNNVPAIFRGCISEWNACSKWNPSSDGLDYLERRVGSAEVEAMLSMLAPVFCGDLRSHERVPLSFFDFIQVCKKHKRNKEDGTAVNVNSGSIAHDTTNVHMDHNCQMPEDTVPGQLYLAQVPILNAEKEEKVQLKILSEDIETPTILKGKFISLVNLWMNSEQARSTTHYDPHHNLLCVVSGRKRVILWPPSACPMLYPMPIYGEASNHSSVALENPDFSKYPRAEHSLEYSHEIVLDAGDALFIPEGWFHQVDSDDLTIAVNFWWQSSTMSSLSEHMDSYYLRRIMRRLIDREMNLVLPKPSSSGIKHLTEPINDQSKVEQTDKASDKKTTEGGELQERKSLHDLDPYISQALHELISIVHERVNVASQGVQSTSSSSEPTSGSNACKIQTMELFCLGDDPVAHILWKLEPSRLQAVLLAMARFFPRTLEALIVHVLSPVAAEVLTQKFEEMDQQTNEEEMSKFFRELYGAFDDQFAAMDAILNKKESFALQAFKNVLEKNLGVDSSSTKM